ncbi:MAG TPA: FeoA family protein [Kofleriaceae bacterium]
MPTLADTPLGKPVMVQAVDGARAFRRRLLEMGLVPGTPIKIVTVAPLGDPLRIEVRGGQWSIRRAEAGQIQVTPLAHPATAAAPSTAMTQGAGSIAQAHAQAPK